jgi:protocatechuate 3,4-dioxygenase beta subunit
MRTWRWTCAWLMGVAVWTQAAGVAADVRQTMVSLAPPGEPGEPMLIEGRILAPDGRGLPNVELYVYQTDARGLYSASGSDERNPRLRARFRTDAEGRYQFRTIKPGPYPNSGPPAHIHLEVSPLPGSTERFEIVFEGDPRLNADIRKDATPGGFYSICTARKDAEGTLRCKGADFQVR